MLATSLPTWASSGLMPELILPSTETFTFRKYLLLI